MVKTIEVLEAVNAVSAALLSREHERDEDCTVVDGECVVCHVDHSGECASCHGHGYHYPDCGESDETVDAHAAEHDRALHFYGSDR